MVINTVIDPCDPTVCDGVLLSSAFGTSVESSKYIFRERKEVGDSHPTTLYYLGVCV